MGEAWIIDAARTPRAIGKQGKGALWEIHPQKLLSTVLSALVERNGRRRKVRLGFCRTAHGLSHASSCGDLASGRVHRRPLHGPRSASLFVSRVTRLMQDDSTKSSASSPPSVSL